MLSFDQPVPVTVIATQRVSPGAERAFEAWLHRVAREALAFEGHLGLNVLRPAAGSDEYIIIFRFAKPDQLKAWLESDVRTELLAELAALGHGSPQLQRLSGIEAWFDLPALNVRRPARYKMAILSFAAVFPLLLALPELLRPLLSPLPPLARSALVCASTVLTLTYAALPLLTRAFSRWLYPALV